MSRLDPVDRARRLLTRHGAWLEAVADGYALRLGTRRDAAVLQVVNETAFLQLVERPGLRVRTGGGWIVQKAGAPGASAPPPGRPGVIDGVREVVEGGRRQKLPANLALTSIEWLARHRNASGEPWLTTIEIAAARQLSQEAEAALTGPSVTMRWDALPRSGGGRRSGASEPGERALSAGRRVALALAACGPAKELVDRICIRSSALQVAEQALGLKQRSGKLLLKQGLQALARHYRLL
ncbi:DUF6456 domain-containing protein [Brevundimonas kwangchunensis]|uniref:DUF6456 domain-containing protein n=1 Tax=Brevundimonas kwangchunensis TaxID=322163 RepID=A0ABN1GG26_9CAUL